MELGQHLFLQQRVEVDEQVAAAHQVDLAEGRGGDDVVRGEDHHFADPLAHLVLVLLFDEKRDYPLF